MIGSGCFHLTEVAFHVAIESIVVILERLCYEDTCLVKIFCQTLFIISLSICVNYCLLIVIEQLIYSKELYHKKHSITSLITVKSIHMILEEEKTLKRNKSMISKIAVI